MGVDEERKEIACGLVDTIGAVSLPSVVIFPRH